ncbi:MAG: hypothetical protein J7L69_01800 [Desulfobulbaceae bacterium]|nr:hypothetical protein [Desulfobulbaceae bacterium]
MSFLKKITPTFWNHRELGWNTDVEIYVYRRKWMMLILFISVLTFIPLGILTAIFYQMSSEEILNELNEETKINSENAALELNLYFEEYINNLGYITVLYSRKELTNQKTLQLIFQEFKKSHKGFLELDVLDEQGKILTSTSGLHQSCLKTGLGHWLDNVKKREAYTSTSCGNKHNPHLVIGRYITNAKGESFILRGTLNNLVLGDLLGKFRLADIQDVFLSDSKQQLLTRSKYFGNPGKKVPYPFMEHLPDSGQITDKSLFISKNKFLIIGASHLSGTNFTVGVVITESQFLRLMSRTTSQIMYIMIPAGVMLLLFIIGFVSYAIDRLYLGDMQRNLYMEQLEQTDKLSSIGRLAAGVAHEVNNPLAIINEKAGLLQDLFTFVDEYKNDKRLMDTVDAIITAVERAGTITHRLLGFSRKMNSSVEECEPAQVINDVIGFVKKEAEYKNITIDINLDETMPRIITDRGKLQQILLNLATNAFHAMDEGGRLEIKGTMDKKKQKIFIKIHDNGCGISPESLKHIFDPFFTTKSRAGGTGLGLAISHGLIHDLKGSLDVESTVGVGTTFTITLPYLLNFNQGV